MKDGRKKLNILVKSNNSEVIHNGVFLCDDGILRHGKAAHIASFLPSIEYNQKEFIKNYSIKVYSKIRYYGYSSDVFVYYWIFDRLVELNKHSVFVYARSESIEINRFWNSLKIIKTESKISLYNMLNLSLDSTSLKPNP